MAPAISSKGNVVYPEGGRRRSSKTSARATTADRSSPTTTSTSDERGSSLQLVARGVIDVVAKLAQRISPPAYLIGVQRRLTLAGKDPLTDR